MAVWWFTHDSHMKPFTSPYQSQIWNDQPSEPSGWAVRIDQQEFSQILTAFLVGCYDMSYFWSSWFCMLTWTWHTKQKKYLWFCFPCIYADFPGKCVWHSCLKAQSGKMLRVEQLLIWRGTKTRSKSTVSFDEHLLGELLIFPRVQAHGPKRVWFH